MEESNDVRDVNQNASSEVVNESTEKNDSVSYDSYKKLLSQRKADQERVRELEEKFNLIQESKLEAEGKKEELVESLRARLEEKESSLTNVKKQYATKTLTEQIKSKAIASGCKPNYADKLIKLLDDSDLKAIEVDENYMVNNDDLTIVLEKAKKEIPDFFTKQVSIADTTPSAQFTYKPSDRSKLSTQDLINDYIKNVK